MDESCADRGEGLNKQERNVWVAGLDLSTCNWTLVQIFMCLYLYLDPKYLKNTKYIQVQTSTLYLIICYMLYLDSSKLCVDTIE